MSLWVGAWHSRRFRFLLPPIHAAVSLQIIREEHASIAAVLRSLQVLAPGPGDNPPSFFDAGARRFFPRQTFLEREHHPKESEHLFPAWRSVPHVAEGDCAAGC